MKNVMRVVSMLLLVAFFCTALAACNNNEGGESSTDESVQLDGGFYGYNLPEEAYYEDEVVRVLTLGAYQIKPENNPEYSEEKLSAVLSAASECTRKVEQRLGVTVEEEAIVTGSRYGGPFYQRVVSDAMSDTADYLFIMPALTEAAMLATDGLLYDMNALVNLDNPWWCKDFNDAVTIAGKTYFVSGDITTVGLASTMFVLFNKRIESTHELAKSYGYNSMYELVDNNAWTQDVMFEMAKKVFVDSNENNKPDPDDDLVGMSAQTNIVYWLLRSGGINVCTLDSDGYPALTVNHARALTLINNAQQYCQDPKSGLLIADDYKDYEGPMNPAPEAFYDGRGLFLFNAISAMDAVRSMKDDFGVLPCPKFDKDQEKYSNNVGAWTSNCIAIPTSIDESKLQLAVHFIESLGAISRELLTPAYFEQTLQYQISRDDDSVRMLKLISENRAPDLSEMYRWGKMMQTISEMRTSPLGTFVSAYDAIDEQTILEIEDTVELFKNMEN